MTTTNTIHRRRRLRRVVAVGLLVCVGTWLLAGWATVAVVTAPQRCSIEPIRALAGAPVSDVSVVAEDGVDLQGWLVHASDRRVVALFAGIGGNRRSLLGLAEHYVGRGWSVLMPDLRATGASSSDRIGLGYPERLDVRAWTEFARARGFVDIGLHGQSRGAAAIAYSMAGSGDEHVKFVVLDSCYDDIRNALANRLPWVPLPRLVLKPVEWIGGAVLDVRADVLRPTMSVHSMQSPTLFIAGDADTKVRPVETERLFNACGSMCKQLLWIRDAGHTNLWTRASGEYAAALDAFLATVAVQPVDALDAADGPSGRG